MIQILLEVDAEGLLDGLRWVSVLEENLATLRVAHHF